MAVSGAETPGFQLPCWRLFQPLHGHLHIFDELRLLGTQRKFHEDFRQIPAKIDPRTSFLAVASLRVETAETLAARSLFTALIAARIWRSVSLLLP